MSLSQRKLEITMVGLAVVVAGGLSYLLKTPARQALKEIEMVYEMPRPRSFFASLFDLGGREISRTYVNPYAKQVADTKMTEKKAEIPGPAKKKQIAQKPKATKKKPDDKVKNNNVDVRVVDAEKVSPIQGGESFAGGSSRPFGHESVGNGKEAKATEQVAANTLSGAQWRALILAQPTQDNVNKLLQAYGNQEVDDGTFYTIVTDLLRDNKIEHQKLGLYAVNSVFSVKSFSVVSQYYDQLAPENQAKAQSYLMSYAVTARFGHLMSALQSSQVATVEAAAEVVMQGYVQAQKGEKPTIDPRLSRIDGNKNIAADYSRFVPIFQQLAKSQDNYISGIAQSALSQIQLTVAAL